MRIFWRSGIIDGSNLEGKKSSKLKTPFGALEPIWRYLTPGFSYNYSDDQNSQISLCRNGVHRQSVGRGRHRHGLAGRDDGLRWRLQHWRGQRDLLQLWTLGIEMRSSRTVWSNLGLALFIIGEINQNNTNHHFSSHWIVSPGLSVSHQAKLHNWY